MLPLLVAAGGLGLGAAAFFGLKSRCKTCESIFTLNESCLVCGEDVCGDCGLESPKIERSGGPVSPKGRVCKNHLTHLTDKIETFNLGLERGFRNAYNAFIKKLHEQTLQPEDLFVVVPQGGVLRLFFLSLISFSVWPFYGTLAGMIYAAKALVI